MEGCVSLDDTAQSLSSSMVQGEKKAESRREGGWDCQGTWGSADGGPREPKQPAWPFLSRQVLPARVGTACPQ